MRNLICQQARLVCQIGPKTLGEVATAPRGIVKIAKPTVEISDKVRLNLEKFVWSSREK
jgi:hypothetical protein